MKFPPFVVGAAALFWGWQTGNLALAVLLALLLEGARFTTLRFELREVDYERIADFCVVLFAGIAVLLLVTRGATRGVLSALQWLPVVIAPVMLAQRFGRSGLIRVSALFYYVRRQVRRDPTLSDRLIDMSGPYAALLVLAAGTPNTRGPGYYAGVLLLFGWALFAFRPRHSRWFAFPLLFLVAAAVGYAAHVELNRLQSALEGWFDDWLVELPSDAQRVETRIGTLGRLKQHDTIAMRVYAPASGTPPVKLLHAASFNEYRKGAWIAHEPRFPYSAPPGAPARELSIVLRMQRGMNLLPLPLGIIDVRGAPDLPAKTPALGTVSIRAPGGWLRYEARYTEKDGWYAPPAAEDLSVPASERAALEQVAKTLALDAGAPTQAVETLRRHFDDFTYSTWRDKEVPAGMTALEDFLLHSKTGHCEYFAAATTLLLRAAGIPARYATGYALIDYSPLEEAWVVRARHAHAWSRAYINGRWTDVDLTPPSWPEAEAELQPSWEPIEDFVRWLVFRLTNGGENERSGAVVLLALVLAAVIGWRFLRKRKRSRQRPAAAHAQRPGEDSEFYQVERALAARFRARSPHESLQQWCSEIEARLSDEERGLLQRLAELHHRYRFDPLGLSREERKSLKDGASAFPAEGIPA